MSTVEAVCLLEGMRWYKVGAIMQVLSVLNVLHGTRYCSPSTTMHIMYMVGSST